MNITKYYCLAFLFIVIGLRTEVLAQKSKIVVVYDTVYVYDTVHVFSINKRLSEIIPAQLKRKEFVFLKNKSATFSPSAIIIDESKNENNLNSIKMKKLSFIALLALSFQHMVLAQTDYGITVGNNIWVNNTMDRLNPKYDPKFSFAGPQVGAYSSTHLSNTFSLRVDLQYSYLIGREDHKVINEPGILDEHFYKSDYHQFRLPVRLTLTKGRIKPSLGLSYNYSIAAQKLKDTDENRLAGFGEPNDEYVLTLSNFSAIAGVDYHLSNKVSLNLNYAIGLNAPALKTTGDKSAFSFTNIEPRLHQINFSLSYKLNKDL